MISQRPACRGPPCRAAPPLPSSHGVRVARRGGAAVARAAVARRRSGVGATPTPGSLAHNLLRIAPLLVKGPILRHSLRRPPSRRGCEGFVCVCVGGEAFVRVHGERTEVCACARALAPAARQRSERFKSGGIISRFRGEGVCVCVCVCECVRARVRVRAHACVRGREGEACPPLPFTAFND